MDEREIFSKLMKKQMPEGPMRDLLRQLRVRPTYGNSIAFQMVKKAAEGDLSAAKYILAVMQEAPDVPTAATDLRELSTEELRKMLDPNA